MKTFVDTNVRVYAQDATRRGRVIEAIRAVPAADRIALHLLHDLHLRDGIIAAGCCRLLSEDLADGAQIEGLRVVSPFA